MRTSYHPAGSRFPEKPIQFSGMLSRREALGMSVGGMALLALGLVSRRVSDVMTVTDTLQQACADEFQRSGNCHETILHSFLNPQDTDARYWAIFQLLNSRNSRLQIEALIEALEQDNRGVKETGLEFAKMLRSDYRVSPFIQPLFLEQDLSTRLLNNENENLLRSFVGSLRRWLERKSGNY